MAISSTAVRNTPYTGDGTSTAFPTGFVFQNPGDLQVLSTVVATGAVTTLTLNSDYTVSGGSPTGDPTTGTVTLGTALAVGTNLNIVGNAPLTQQTEYVDNNPLPAAALMANLDKLTILRQEVQERLNRAILFSPSSGISSINISTPVPGDLLYWSNSTTLSSISTSGIAIAGNITGAPGIVAQIDTNGHFAAITITGTANQITVTNGSGVSANPTISLPTNVVFPGTGAIQLPSGTTGQEPTGVAGMLRFNTTTGLFEGYTTSWGSVTGATYTGTANQVTVSGTVISLPSAITTPGSLTTTSTLAAGTALSSGTTITAGSDFVTSSAGKLKFVNGSYNVSFSAPSLSGTTAWVLPAADGAANTVLKTDGSANLGFATPSISGTANQITVTGSNPVAGSTLSLPSSLTVPGSLTTTTALISGTTIATGSASALKLVNGSNFLGLVAPSLSGNTTWTLPATDGTNGQVLATNGSGTLSWGTGGGAASNFSTVTQTAHGFTTGQVVYLSGASTYALSKADAAATAESVGVVGTTTTNTFQLFPTGSYISGLSGLTVGPQFLSDSSAGALTATAPTTAGHIQKPILWADTTTSGWVNIELGATVTATVAAAAKSDMTTATSTTTYVTPGRLQYSPAVSKASAVITPGGTTTTYTNNVTSITRTAAGDYTLNITNAFANTTDLRIYANCISASTMLVGLVQSVSTSAIRVQFRNTSGTLTDPSGAIMVDVFGTM